MMTMRLTVRWEMLQLEWKQIMDLELCDGAYQGLDQLLSFLTHWLRTWALEIYFLSCIPVALSLRASSAF